MGTWSVSLIHIYKKEKLQSKTHKYACSSRDTAKGNKSFFIFLSISQEIAADMLPAALACVFFVSQQYFYYTISFLCFCSVMFSSTLSASWPCCGFEVMQAWLFLALGTSVLLCCPLHLQYLLCPDGPDAQPNCHSKLAVPHTPLSIPMSTPASAGSVLYSQHYFSSYHHTLVTGS